MSVLCHVGHLGVWSRSLDTYFKVDTTRKTYAKYGFFGEVVSEKIFCKNTENDWEIVIFFSKEQSIFIRTIDNFGRVDYL